ncbi:MAG: hypothetical protein AB7K09_23765 [Planctomycetota bacterium]
MRIASIFTLIALAFVAAPGCGTAEGGRYDSQPVRTAPQPEAGGPAIYGHGQTLGYQPGSYEPADATDSDDSYRAPGSSLDAVPGRYVSARSQSTAAALQALAAKQAERKAAEKAAEAESSNESAKDDATADDGLPAAVNGEPYVDPDTVYDGHAGYPYAERVIIKGAHYRRVWVSPTQYYLDGVVVSDGKGGFIYPASSGARVWYTNPYNSGYYWNPRTRADKRIAARRGQYAGGGGNPRPANQGFGGNGFSTPPSSGPGWTATPGATYRPYNTHQ